MLHETVWCNKAAIHIANDDVFHERTKHIEVDCHIVHKKIEDKFVVAKHVSSGHQLIDVLIKPLGKIMVDFICDKLGMYDVYASVWEGVLGNIISIILVLVLDSD